jgi:hypothetical protein
VRDATSVGTAGSGLRNRGATSLQTCLERGRGRLRARGRSRRQSAFEVQVGEPGLHEFLERAVGVSWRLPPWVALCASFSLSRCSASFLLDAVASTRRTWPSKSRTRVRARTRPGLNVVRSMSPKVPIGVRA